MIDAKNSTELMQGANPLAGVALAFVGVGVMAEAMIAGLLLHPAVVRAMPNTPAQIGRGMTVWTTTAQVSDAQAAQVRAMLGALGREMRVEEERQIDMATALSATGPTYIFMLMEALV